jgi:hypothetical protein
VKKITRQCSRGHSWETDSSWEACPECMRHNMQNDLVIRSDAVDRIPDSPAALGLGALDVQVGGGHYKDCGIQPIEYIQANELTFLEGCIVKRITRHTRKNGAEDIRKIKHECDLILQLVYGAD